MSNNWKVIWHKKILRFSIAHKYSCQLVFFVINSLAGWWKVWIRWDLCCLSIVSSVLTWDNMPTLVNGLISLMCLRSDQTDIEIATVVWYHCWYRANWFIKMILLQLLLAGRWKSKLWFNVPGLLFYFYFNVLFLS